MFRLTAPATAVAVAASAAAAASTSPYHSFELSPALSAPEILDAKRSLLAVPSGMVKSMNAGRSGSRGKALKKKSGGRARDGAIFSKFFNELAARPVPRNGLSMEQGITLEMEFYDLGFLATSTITNATASSQFSLSNFLGSTALTSVFDQYKFEQVEVWLEPTAAQGSTVFANLITAVDLDDASVPTAAISDRQGALQGYGGAGRYHKWVPHMAVAVYSGTFTSFANERAGWIDSASPNVQHYGFKSFAVSTPVIVKYDLTVRAVISFRAPNNS